MKALFGATAANTSTPGAMISGFRTMGLTGSGPLEEKSATWGAGFIAKLVNINLMLLISALLAFTTYSLTNIPELVGRTRLGM